jgi:hypothetical protein
MLTLYRYSGATDNWANCSYHRDNTIADILVVEACHEQRMPHCFLVYGRNSIQF